VCMVRRGLSPDFFSPEPETGLFSPRGFFRDPHALFLVRGCFICLDLCSGLCFVDL